MASAKLAGAQSGSAEIATPKRVAWPLHKKTYRQETRRSTDFNFSSEFGRTAHCLKVNIAKLTYNISKPRTPMGAILSCDSLRNKDLLAITMNDFLCWICLKLAESLEIYNASEKIDILESSGGAVCDISSKRLIIVRESPLCVTK
uniref:Uncharacterized protein n=1 Tax=Romanomermis culicivorax TaxID=13658 RepID=A0A915JE10_ROMCU